MVARLARGDVYAVSVTFPEGLTVREMAAIFGRSGLAGATSKPPRTIARSPRRSIPARLRLEGDLFPSTYTLSHRAGAAEAVRMMLNQFRKVFDGKMRDAPRPEMTVRREVVTLASVIEKETAQAEERPLVSAVFQNRLQQRMPLQCDPTVIYALVRAGRGQAI